MRKQTPPHQKKTIAQPGRPGKPQDSAPAANPTGKPWKTAWRDLFAIDARSLALFRIVVGVLILVDLAIRATDLSTMYTDSGMFPREEICRRATTIWNWSFHFGSGAWGYQAALFSLAAVLGLALVVGCGTRLVTIGSWLMLVSLHHRVPPILSGAENLHRMLLFWAMFLPLGQAWSVDGWLAKRRSQPGTTGAPASVLSIASAAILLQMALMYFFSAMTKSNSDWSSGRAIAGSLAHSFYASPTGAYLLQFPGLLSAMTVGTLALEWAAPLLLFCPWGTGRMRLILIGALAAMHLGIGFCLEVGLFSYVALAGLTLFVPTQFWNSRLIAGLTQRLEDFSEPAFVGRLRKYRHPPFFYPTQILCLLVLLYVIAVNINTFPSRPLASLAPERWRLLSRGLGLSQVWGMFGAIPSKDGWYVARAKLNDGSQIDLLRDGAAVDWAKPEFPARLYPNYFWQKLFREMTYDDEQGFQLMRAPVAEYLCRQWNARNPSEKQIAEFEFIYCLVNHADAGSTAAPQILREQLVHLNLTGRW